MSMPTVRRSIVSCYLMFFSFALRSASVKLYSFPTRRSSDLARVGDLLLAHHRAQSRCAVLRPDGGGATRSEEHTSELQSHSDLVCRLLLEKKNEAARQAFRLTRERHLLVQ